MTDRTTTGLRTLIQLSAGFLLWSAAFLTLYVTLTLGCTFGWHETSLVSGLSLQRGVLVALFAAAVLAFLWLFNRQGTRKGLTSDKFLFQAGSWIAVAGFAATLLTFAPTVALSPCH